jgi:hypothetical protein
VAIAEPAPELGLAEAGSGWVGGAAACTGR